MLLINLLINFFNVLKVTSLECMSMINQKCMPRPKIIDVNNNEPVFYPYSVKVNKYSGSCNNINDPYAKLCVPDITKNINVKVFNLMSRINEIKQIIWHETCKCMRRLSNAICHTKQIWNNDRCRCECKEDLVSKINCNKRYSWNPSICECECDKSCGIGEYLDLKNCTCKKSIIDRLIEECSNTIEENSDILVNTSNNTLYFNLFIVFLVLFLIGIGVLVYFYWYKGIKFKRKDKVESNSYTDLDLKGQVNY